MLSSEDKMFIVKSLTSEECFCGDKKQRGYSFCYKCYRILPKEIQRNLYQKIGHGYESAYEEATKYLLMEK